MSSKQFNFKDYLRARQVFELSKKIEEREKRERKTNYLEKLTDERRSELMKIYDPTSKNQPQGAIKPTVVERRIDRRIDRRIEPKVFLKKTDSTSLVLPRRNVVFKRERNQNNNIKLYDNKISDLNVNVNKKGIMERIHYAGVFNQRKYNNFTVSEYLYVPTNDIPVMGWIQHCVFCHNETTSIENIEKYKLYCCNRCQKKHSYNDKRLMSADIIQYFSRLR